MPLWNVRDWGATGGFSPYNSSLAVDETPAILDALNYLATNKLSGTLYFPAGNYIISDTSAVNQNTQGISISGTGGLNFGLSLTASTPLSSPPVLLNTASASVNYTGVTGTTATNIQNALRGMNSVIPGANGITCAWNGTVYLVTFPASLGAPVMTISPPTGLATSIQVLTSGAGLIAQNLYGVRLLGDGSSLADYDLPGTNSVGFSRSTLVWNGTSNGIMLHLLGCQGITIENLCICGQLTSGAGSRARTGLLFSKGSGLTCRSATFTRCASAATPAVSGCVQLGLDQTETGGDATVFDACFFGPGYLPHVALPGGQTWSSTAYTGTGMLILPPSSVNHQLHACTMLQLGIGAWLQQGGNLQWDRCKADAVGTVLKIGGMAPLYYAGGSNPTAFLMNNVRTSPSGGPNPVVADAAFANNATNVTVQGWDDTAANSQGSPIALIQEQSAAASAATVSVPLTVSSGGHALVAFAAAVSGGTVTASTLVDSNNTWIFIASAKAAPTQAVTAGMWYCANANAVSTTVTFNAPTPATGCCLVIHEYSNVDTVAAQALDAFASSGGPGTITAVPSSGPVSGPGGVPGVTYWGGMLVGFTAQHTAGVTYTAGTGFTLRANSGAVIPIAYASEDYYATGPGPFGATFGQGGVNTAWICLGIALKPSTDFAPGFLVGAGPGIMLRDSLASRTTMAQEAVLNPPTATTPATFRMENLIVPEGTLGAALCPGLTTNTKVDHVAERTGTYNVIRPDVTTILGRPRYSPVNYLIQQQKPKYFFDLGDLGFVAPNQGWNLFISSSVPRTDGRYVFPLAQNVQGVIQSDAVGAFDPSNTGYVSLQNGNLNLGPVGTNPWTLIAVIKRTAGLRATVHPIVCNLASGTSNGGLHLFLDDGNLGRVTFDSYNGATPRTPLLSNSTWQTAGQIIYIMVQASQSGGNSTVSLYINGAFDNSVTYAGTPYTDNSVVPAIGYNLNTIYAAVQISRVATFDLLVPLSVFSEIYQAGTTFQGR